MHQLAVSSVSLMHHYMQHLILAQDPVVPVGWGGVKLEQWDFYLSSTPSCIRIQKHAGEIACETATRFMLGSFCVSFKTSGDEIIIMSSLKRM